MNIFYQTSTTKTPTHPLLPGDNLPESTISVIECRGSVLRCHVTLTLVDNKRLKKSRVDDRSD